MKASDFFYRHDNEVVKLFNDPPEGSWRNWRRFQTMEELWEKGVPQLVVWVATRPLVLNDIATRIVTVQCARRLDWLLAGEGHVCLQAAERFASGEKVDISEFYHRASMALDKEIRDGSKGSFFREQALRTVRAACFRGLWGTPHGALQEAFQAEVMVSRYPAYISQVFEVRKMTPRFM